MKTRASALSAVLLLVAGQALAAAPVPAEPPVRFDLECQVRRVGRRVRPVAPHLRLRIDLENRVWCEDRCEAVRALDMSDEALTLSAPDETSGETVVRRKVTVSRRTADLRDERRIYLHGDPVADDVVVGRCRLRPYSGVGRKLF